jgi:hypothetical protein
MREAVGLHDDGARHGEPPRSGPQVADDFGTDDKPRRQNRPRCHMKPAGRPLAPPVVPG